MLQRIGVFDSGIGGLTVLRELRRVFPALDMVYLGDLARVPYGGRSVETITRYARDDMRFLLRFGLDAVVVACGTVSSNSLEPLRKEFPVPVYGVIDSAARLAEASADAGAGGVIGTRATVASGAYERALHALNPRLRVISQACPLIVPLVENGVAPDDPVAELVCARYMEPFRRERTDALILGCTHYPVYRSAFQRLLPQTRMIHVGEALAEFLREEFGGCTGGEGRTEYYVTERSAAFDETVRIMDQTVDPSSIRVETDFLG